MSAMRDLPAQMQSVKPGHWQSGVGKTLRGRRIALHGNGRVAKAVATYAKAFGMDVVWWSSEAGRERVGQDGETVADSREAFFHSVMWCLFMFA